VADIPLCHNAIKSNSACAPVYLSAYKYACLHVLMCICVCMCVSVYVRMSVCVHVCMYACRYARMHACMYVSARIYEYIGWGSAADTQQASARRLSTLNHYCVNLIRNRHKHVIQDCMCVSECLCVFESKYRLILLRPRTPFLCKSHACICTFTGTCVFLCVYVCVDSWGKYMMPGTKKRGGK